MSVDTFLATFTKNIRNKAFIINSNANIHKSVTSLFFAKSGAIKNLTSVQSIIVVDEVYELVKQELICRSAYFLNCYEQQLLHQFLLQNKKFNLEIKLSVQEIAKLAGIQLKRELYDCNFGIYCPLPNSYNLLIAETEILDIKACAYNMLANYPILAMYRY